jgi:repressor LexA
VTAKRLTNPRGQILDAIRASMRERGIPPTMRELADTVGLASTSSVEHHLRVLAEQGAIRRLPGAARAVVIADIHPTQDEAAPDAPGTAPDPQKEIQP